VRVGSMKGGGRLGPEWLGSEKANHVRSHHRFSLKGGNVLRGMTVLFYC
jgi:hypothetical protein